jgi:protease II
MRPHLSSPVAASPLAEPQAEQHPLERTLHDLRLIDEYAWLKAENWREVSAIRLSSILRYAPICKPSDVP